MVRTRGAGPRLRDDRGCGADGPGGCSPRRPAGQQSAHGEADGKILRVRSGEQ
ncbi:hypothetical protein C8Q77DRAFT_1105331 [Trametes polyzona]|nr:hypothetical protein C8Q77DRAFT_1105331 [Trametes polyzona]